MSDNNKKDGDINFSSTDIKKRDLEFNVKEKDSVKLHQALTGFGKKLTDFPLFKGKNKYITLGVAVLVVATAITLPIVLPSLLSSPTPDPTPEQQQEEQKAKEDTADTVNNIDPTASADTQDAILADLDAKIASASAEDKYLYYIPAKAVALQKYGRYDEAVEAFKSITDDLRSNKQWIRLADNYASISRAYRDAGNKESAIEYLRGALAIIDEAASDPEKPEVISGREYYQAQINTLENS